MKDLSKFQVYKDAMELANAVMKSHGQFQLSEARVVEAERFAVE